MRPLSHAATPVRQVQVKQSEAITGVCNDASILCEPLSARRMPLCAMGKAITPRDALLWGNLSG